MVERKISDIFDKTYKDFAQGIFRYIYFKVSDYKLAEDITGETFVRYWKRLLEKKAVDNPKALLYFIAKGLIIDFYRKKKNIKNLSLEIIDERLLSSFDKTEKTLSEKETLEHIFKTIQKLDTIYRDVLFLHFVEDLSIKEIAYIQKKNENAVRVSLHRALKLLKGKL